RRSCSGARELEQPLAREPVAALRDELDEPLLLVLGLRRGVRLHDGFLRYEPLREDDARRSDEREGKPKRQAEQLRLDVPERVDRVDRDERRRRQCRKEEKDGRDELPT